MTAIHDAAPDLECRNCGAALEIDPHPRFCPRCGQETRLHPPSFSEFVHEFAAHYVALEGALWRTLSLLLFAPGRLTLEYLAGRRRRYVLPLRLYLTASFVLFIVFNLLAAVPMGLTIDFTPDAKAGQQQGSVGNCIDTPASCTLPQRLRAAVMKQAMRASERPEVLGTQMRSMLPYALIALQPVCAGILQLVYRRRQLAYGAHFVHTLHLHAFAFLLLPLAIPMPNPWDAIIPTLICIYTLRSMSRVYGGRRRWLHLRFVSVALLYTAALVLTTVLLVVAAVAAA